MTKRSHFRAWILCGALGALFCATSDAGAQPTADPNKRAVELYKKGNDFYDKSKWADAENMYRAAFDLRQTYDIAGNLGDVEMIQGKPREAAEHLSFAIRNFPTTGKPAQKEALRKRLGEAAALIGTVNITVTAAAAEVSIDGKLVGKAPLEHEIYVDRGEHTIEAKREGFVPAGEKITASAGSKHDVTLTLKEKEKPKPAAPPPVADDNQHGLFAGKNLALVVGGGIITTAALAVGIGTAAASNGKASDADALSDSITKPNGCAPPVDAQFQTSCSSLLEARKDQGSLANTSVTSFVVAGVAGAATVTYLIWSVKKSKTPASVRPVPVLTAEESGLWVQGTF